MNNKNLYNAYIKNWWIKEWDDGKDGLRLGLEVKSTEGTAMLKIPLQEINQLFSILSITDINKLTGRPCLALITHGILRTIGDFMFKSSEVVFRDEVQIYLHDKNYWLDFDAYLEYKDD